MDFIKDWTYTICITLIISVIFSLLTPKGNMGRFFKIILAAFIFLSFIYPLKNSKFDIELPQFSISEFEASEKTVFENTVTMQITSILEKAGYTSCTVKSDIDFKNNEIYVNSVSVSIPNSYKKDDVKNYLFDSVGILAEVYYVGE